jgi:hypothetical protein
MVVEVDNEVRNRERKGEIGQRQRTDEQSGASDQRG